MKNQQIIKKIFYFLSIFLFIELLSYFSLFNHHLNIVVFSCLSLAFFILTIKNLEYGLLAIFSELLVGSMGRMFSIDLLGLDLSIRMSFWLIAMLVFTGKLLWSFKNNGLKNPYLISLKQFKFKYHFLILAGFVFIGLIIGLINDHEISTIFKDANSWLYYLLILPAIIVYSNKYDEQSDRYNRLKIIFSAAVIWLSFKTFWLLYIFTHNLNIAPVVYSWLRQTLVGEMTATSTGWPRIFIQGQIFAALGLFFSFWEAVKKDWGWKKSLLSSILASLFTGVLLISFSRSFWLALVITLLVLMLTAWRLISSKKMLFSVLWLGTTFLISFGLLYLTSIFPYPRSGNFNADFAGRADISNNKEAAISSRWSLLPVLLNEIKIQPFFGQGYGATITYISNDPRVLERDPSGSYKTYAFEWGYLDICLKIGFLGLMAYLSLIFSLLKNSWLIVLEKKSTIILGLLGGLIFISITNFFTPYLNHPLGMGIIIISSCLISKYRVY